MIIEMFILALLQPFLFLGPLVMQIAAGKLVKAMEVTADRYSV